MGTISTMGLVALAAVLWGANFNLASAVIGELHPLTAAAARFAIAAITMAVIAWSRGERIQLRRHAGAYALLGGVGIAGFNLPFFFGMQSTSAVNGALIMATSPILTALMAAVLLGERPSRRQVMALPVALTGVAVVVLGAHPGPVSIAWGDGLMLVANLAWSSYTVLGKRFMPPGPAIANTAGIMTMGAIGLSLAAVAAQAPLALPGPKASAALMVMALGGSALAYLCWNAGVTRLGAGRTALFLNLVPVSTMVIGAVTGTPPTLVQLFGGAVVLAAVSAAMLPAKARRVRSPISPPQTIGAFALSPSEEGSTTRP